MLIKGAFVRVCFEVRDEIASLRRRKPRVSEHEQEESSVPRTLQVLYESPPVGRRRRVSSLHDDHEAVMHHPLQCVAVRLCRQAARPCPELSSHLVVFCNIDACRALGQVLCWKWNRLGGDPLPTAISRLSLPVLRTDSVWSDGD